MTGLPTQLSQIKDKTTIIGAGPVGSMLAIILARAGYQVELFESRPDSRVHSALQGKSINITLSERAWSALEYIGLEEQVRQFSTPLYSRIFYDASGNTSTQEYGHKNHALWSMSREKLTNLLLNQAAQETQVNLHFEQRLTHIDFNSGCASFSYLKSGKMGHKEVDSDYIFAADGAFSKVRRLAQETPRFSYSQHYMQQCYIELTIAANKDGSAKLNANASHIWPRKDFLLVALPNSDASFTCTLYLNYQGQPSFDSLQTPSAITDFFQQHFSDVFPLLENPVTEFLCKTPNPLFLVSVDPWVINNKVTLIGDAAHAMVPFYGQGLNCSFEDCHQLALLIKSQQGDWQKILPAYYQQRKKNADAISKLSKECFSEISCIDESANKVLRKKIVEKLLLKQPLLWQPLDQMISFSPDIPYAKAREISAQQKSILNEVMQINNIHQCWQQDFVVKQLDALTLEKLVPLL